MMGTRTRTPTGADALCQALLDEGVDVVFGHPGGAILPFYDALFRAGSPRHVLVRHEQAAAHAADGYARATGRVGVCIATSGPGATNLVTGLATASMDSVPMVAITGQVASTSLGAEAFQETDIIGVTMAVTKHGFLVEQVQDIPAIVAEAFRLAAAGRPGPVLIDVPKNLQQAAFAGASRPTNDSRPVSAPGTAELDDAVRLLATAQRPVIMAGRGVVLSRTTQALMALSERADLPVSTTLLGLDGFPASHPNAIGLPGMHGTQRANHAIQEADVVLGLGLRFDDRVTGDVQRFAPHAVIIHANIDAASVGRTVRADRVLLGDLRCTLPALVQRLPAARRRDWWARLRAWPRDAGAPGCTCAAVATDDAEPDDHAGPSLDGTSCPTAPNPAVGRGRLHGREVARALARQIAAAGAAVTTDVGQHQMWIAQELLDAAPGTHITSGGLGTMGFALPAAMGVAIGLSGRSVWVVVGDGGFQMTLQELATVVQEGLPLRIAVCNNGYLGMVRQWQEMFYQRRYSGTRLTGPDLATLAAAYGVPSRTVACATQLDPALRWAEAQPGPVLLDLQLEPEENVYPMVRPGAPIDDLILNPAPMSATS
jgi:acetolactate synthase I/II/III large subunit